MKLNVKSTQNLNISVKLLYLVVLNESKKNTTRKKDCSR